MRDDEVYTIQIGAQNVPAFTCGHCTIPVIMRADRVRARSRCSLCSRLLCEKNELCMTGCTPMHSLARDRWESAPKWQSLVPAIMAGHTRLSEASAAGLVL